MNQKPLIETVGLKTYFAQKKTLMRRKPRVVKAVDNVSIQIFERETLGVVGESGCGKSTLGRTILGLLRPTEGEILFEGETISGLSGEKMRELRKKLQVIFQDPYASLNPRMTVLELIRSPLDAFGIGTKEERHHKVMEVIKTVGISENQLYRYPHEFSGGQRQRIVIARALILNPRFIVCDEPVSALDVSIRSQVLNLMKHIQKEYGLTYMFISHDLSVVRYISDRIAVMYLGQLVELAEKKELYERPLHPYTEVLMSAIPIPDTEVHRKRILLEGDVPSPLSPPSGCRFHTRCPKAMACCSVQEPKLYDAGNGHLVCCHLYQKKADEKQIRKVI